MSGRDGRLEEEEDGVEKGGKEWAALEEAKEEQGEKEATRRSEGLERETERGRERETERGRERERERERGREREGARD